MLQVSKNRLHTQKSMFRQAVVAALVSDLQLFDQRLKIRLLSGKTSQRIKC